MLALKRHFSLPAANTAQAVHAYEETANDLHDIVRELTSIGAESLDSWPNGAWASEALTATCREWRRDAANSAGLLEFTWRETQPDCVWLLELAIGWNQTSVAIEEVWRCEGPGRAVPYEQLPPLTHFLSQHHPHNADGKAAAQLLALGPDRVDAFRDFILSPTRQLPVVVLSPRDNRQERTIGESLTTQVMGLAHVIRIQPAAQEPLSSHMSSHKCFGGAIRLYMPGYQTTHKQALHPYWRQAIDIGQVSREIIDLVARESVGIDVNPLIADLRERRGDQLRIEAQRLRRQAHQEAQARLKVEHSIEGYERFLLELSQENEDLRVQNEALADERDVLKDQLRQKDDEIRRLNWRIDGMWHSDTEGEGEEPVDIAPRILLSRKAQETYQSLPDDEKEYWDKNLFPKLLEPEQRNNQTRPVKSRYNNKPCFAYPSKRTADGRRIIYYCDESDVFACEIFTSAQHDRDYDTLRNQGVDRDIYDAFVDLKEL